VLGVSVRMMEEGGRYARNNLFYVVSSQCSAVAWAARVVYCISYAPYNAKYSPGTIVLKGDDEGSSDEGPDNIFASWMRHGRAIKTRVTKIRATKTDPRPDRQLEGRAHGRDALRRKHKLG
jgi:hypothetical protein